MTELRQHPSLLTGLILLLALLFTALFAPWLTPSDPYRVAPWDSLQAPQWYHTLGTDWLGRDIWSRMAHGARVSLQVGLVVEVIAVLIGVLARHDAQRSVYRIGPRVLFAYLSSHP